MYNPKRLHLIIVSLCVLILGFITIGENNKVNGYTPDYETKPNFAGYLYENLDYRFQKGANGYDLYYGKNLVKLNASHSRLYKANKHFSIKTELGDYLFYKNEIYQNGILHDTVMSNKERELFAIENIENNKNTVTDTFWFDKNYIITPKGIFNFEITQKQIGGVEIGDGDFLYSGDNPKGVYETVKVTGADKRTFYTKEGFGIDKNRIYFKDNAVKNIEGTLEVGNAYWKDKKSVFAITKDYKNNANKNPTGPAFYDISGADVNTFIELSGGYGKDKNSVFFWGAKIVGADPDTFQNLSFQYSKDRNNAYYMGKKIIGAHVETFKDISFRYAKDKNNVYYTDKKVNGNVDVETFEANGGHGGRDKNNTYQQTEIIENSINTGSTEKQINNNQTDLDKVLGDILGE